MFYGYHDLIGSLVDHLVVIFELYECTKHWVNIRYGSHALNHINLHVTWYWSVVPMTTPHPCCPVH
jgi:hypothetical protein